MFIYVIRLFRYLGYVSGCFSFRVRFLVVYGSRGLRIAFYGLVLVVRTLLFRYSVGIEFRVCCL